jgi:hypothetical protein
VLALFRRCVAAFPNTSKFQRTSEAYRLAGGRIAIVGTKSSRQSLKQSKGYV